jgi:hypothetical protein
VTDNSTIPKELQSLLAAMGQEEEVDVLIYPSGPTQNLLLDLGEYEKTGRVEYNELELAGCIAVRAPKDVIMQLARRSDVQRIVENPTFTAQGSI